MLKSMSFFVPSYSEAVQRLSNTPDNLKPSITTWWTCNVLQWKVTLRPEPSVCSVKLMLGTFTEAEFSSNHSKSLRYCCTQSIVDWSVILRAVIFHLLVSYLLSACIKQTLVSQVGSTARTWLQIRVRNWKVWCSEWLPVALDGNTSSCIPANLFNSFIF